MAAVIKHDFAGLRIQYQGDRAQALFHLPKDDSSAIAEKAVSAAVGLQSSMAYSLRESLPEMAKLKLAVGIDLDLTLVSKLGTRGERDRICIGLGVQDAEQCQEKCKGEEIGITSAVLELLGTSTKQQFVYDVNRGISVATGYTAEKEERQKKAAAYAGGSAVFVSSSRSGVNIKDAEGAGARQVLPSKSYAD